MPARNRVISARHFAASAVLAGLVALVTLSGCAGDAARLPPQQWGDIVVIVETRPAPVRPGMNEFLVILTETRGVIVSDAVVSIRTDETRAWSQCIQDGHSGVFRKAIAVAPEDRAVTVNIRRGADSVDLVFPLFLEPTAT